MAWLSVHSRSLALESSRARMPVNVPVVLSADEVRVVLKELAGVPRLVATLLYGAGLRLQECLELRVKDIDFDRREVVVRRGKGQKDRRVMLPDAVKDDLRQHLDVVQRHGSTVAVMFRCERFAVNRGALRVTVLVRGDRS